MSFFFISLVAAVFSDQAVAQVGRREATVPPGPTSFSCQGRPPGYYADLETGCRTYHVCDGHSHFTYICPRRTLFQQRMRICDHSYLVHCEDSPQFLEEPEDDPESQENRLTADEDDPEEEVSITEEPTEAATTETTTVVHSEPPATETPTDRPETSPRDKILRFRLKDFRSLFFIPEELNNSVVGEEGVRELALPVDEGHVMRFKNRREFSGTGCPGNCNPKFLLPGRCHPCIMIK